jgi:hypothetical protein
MVEIISRQVDFEGMVVIVDTSSTFSGTLESRTVGPVGVILGKQMPNVVSLVVE